MGYISKKQREEIKQKFEGLCAYSGTPLEDDWQVEHIKPLVRKRMFNFRTKLSGIFCQTAVTCWAVYQQVLKLETK